MVPNIPRPVPSCVDPRRSLSRLLTVILIPKVARSSLAPGRNLISVLIPRDGGIKLCTVLCNGVDLFHCTSLASYYCTLCSYDRLYVYLLRLSCYDTVEV